MPRDGDLDVSKYSREQVEEALRRIDSQRYPKNYQKLIAARATALPAKADPVFGLGKKVRLSSRWSEYTTPILIAVGVVLPPFIAAQMWAGSVPTPASREEQVILALGVVMYVVFLPKLLQQLSVFRVIADGNELEIGRLGYRTIVRMHDIREVVWITRFTPSSSPLAELRYVDQLGVETRAKFVPRSDELVDALRDHLETLRAALASRR